MLLLLLMDFRAKTTLNDLLCEWIVQYNFIVFQQKFFCNSESERHEAVMYWFWFFFSPSSNQFRFCGLNFQKDCNIHKNFISVSIRFYLLQNAIRHFWGPSVLLALQQQNRWASKMYVFITLVYPVHTLTKIWKLLW